MSQDELQHLLGELSLQSPTGSRQLAQLERIRSEKSIWEMRLDQSKKHHDRWLSDQSCLEQLIEERDVNAILSKNPLAQKLLGGAIDLTSPSQSHALAELAVTLTEQGMDPSIPKTARAIHLYYQEYFEGGTPPETVDPQTQSAYEAFMSDPEKGGHEDFTSYLNYLEQLKSILSGNEHAQPEPPTYAPALHLKKMAEQPLGKGIPALVTTTPWDVTHIKALQELFFKVSSTESGQALFEQLQKLNDGISPTFLEKSLKLDHFTEQVHDHLSAMEHAELLALQEVCLELNLDFLLASVNNLVGLDRPGFYRALEKTELPAEVFDKIVDDLFTPRQTSTSYGIDALHLDRVLDQQKDLPQNLVTVLQKALPRGLDGRAIAGALDFFRGLTQQYSEHRDQLASVAVGSSEEATLKKTISDLDSVRFLLFSHIQDRLRSCRAVPKATGMSHEELSKQLHNIYQDELTKGGNANIRTTLEFLYKSFPHLAPVSTSAS